jgi:hypothetical protein
VLHTLRAFSMRLFTFLSLLALSHLALAQQSSESNPASQSFMSSQSSPTQVVYLIGSSTITTYNVDAQTLTGTQAGEPLTVNATNLNYSTTSVAPSANDHAIYVIGSVSQTSQQYLTVYSTNASGVPKTPSLQAIPTTGLFQVQTNPNATFLYAVFQTSNGNYTFVNITRYQVDSEGVLSGAQTVAGYKLPNGGDEFCSVLILGFNSVGSQLYDDVSCSDPGGETAAYNVRAVNSETGALGPDVEVYSWSNFYGGYESVQFVGNEVFNFVTPNSYQTGVNSVNIFPLVPNTTTPTIECTASMLESCGYASGFAHPSGKYILMDDSADFCEIDRVELQAKKIADTGNYIPYSFSSTPWDSHFGANGALIYATGSGSGSNYSIEIYGFNEASSEVTPGESISIPTGDWFLATERR